MSQIDKAFTFRRAVNHDYAHLLRCDPFAQGMPSRQVWLTAGLEAQQIRVAEHSGTVEGFVVIEHTFFGHSFVSLIAVDPNARRQGYALALLAEAARMCCSTKLFTSTNASRIGAQKLLVWAGFVASRHIDNLDTDDTELVYFKSVDAKSPRW